MAKGKKQEVKVGLSSLMQIEKRLSVVEDKLDEHIEQSAPAPKPEKKAEPKSKKK